MTLFRTTLAAAALAGFASAVTGAARAQPIEGIYVGAGAGYNLLEDLTTTVDALPGRPVGGGSPPVVASAPMKVKWGGGYLLSASVGYGLGNGVRLELEGSYRSIDQSRGGPNSGGGSEHELGLMGNVLYDIDFGLDWVSPYVGIGGGYEAVTWSHVDGQASGIDTGSPTAISINQTLGAFAYQFIVGFAFPIDSVPGLAVTAEYRYMNLGASRAYRGLGSTPLVSAAYANNVTRVHAGDDANHSIMVGLRYAFDMPDLVAGPVVRPPPAPEAAPVPAAAQAPTRTYLVFFDWDSADLTPRARDVISEAVRNLAHVPHTLIEVTGHADRSGTARGNQILSLRRAQVVAAELERRGVPTAAIDIHAAGDTRPLVPTPPGVRQAENRRVEIVYR